MLERGAVAAMRHGEHPPFPNPARHLHFTAAYMGKTRKQPALLVATGGDDDFIFRHSMRKAGLDLDVITLTNEKLLLDYITGKNAYSNRATFPLPCLIFL